MKKNSSTKAVYTMKQHTGKQYVHTASSKVLAKERGTDKDAEDEDEDEDEDDDDGKEEEEDEDCDDLDAARIVELRVGMVGFAAFSEQQPLMFRDLLM